MHPLWTGKVSPCVLEASILHGASKLQPRETNFRAPSSVQFVLGPALGPKLNSASAGLTSVCIPWEELAMIHLRCAAAVTAHPYHNRCTLCSSVLQAGADLSGGRLQRPQST